jgi:IclR family acetate operon transcriptional repressor
MSDLANNHVPGAARALDLLEALAGAPDGLSSAELADAVAGARSTLYSLIGTLRDRGYVVQDDARGRYRIGPAVWSLVPDQSDARAALVDAFRSMHDTDPQPETCALVVRVGDTFLVVAEAVPDRPVRAVYPTGSVHPRDRAAALVLRAAAPMHDQHLSQIRRDGFAVTEDDDLVEIATPVCADGITPVAAVTTGIPVHRAGDDVRAEHVAGLRAEAVRLSHRIGARLYAPYGAADAAALGPRRVLSDAEVIEVLHGAWGIQLACVRPDGAPHLVPLWYEWDGDALWLAASPGAVWKQCVAANDAVSLTLDEPWPPLRRVFVHGRARPVDAGSVPGGVGGLRRRLAARYLGDQIDLGPEWTDAAGWEAYRIEPDRLYGLEGLGAAS